MPAAHQGSPDDVRRKQGEPQEAADVGVVDLFGPRDLGDAGVGAVLDELLPSECAGNGLDEGVVDAGAARKSDDAIRTDNELAPSPLVQCQRHMHYEGAPVG